MKTKSIEHKKYTGPFGKKREFEQIIEDRTRGVARRYLPVKTSILGMTLPEFDAAVRKNIEAGEQEASKLARRRYHPHRPKPANNTAKNKARRMKFTLVLGAQTRGNKPEPAKRMNASQMRLNGVAEHRKRNGGRGSVKKHRRVALKTASRRRHKARAKA